MAATLLSVLLFALLSFPTMTTPLAQTTAKEQSSKIVIAHRGASGYLPEHTLEAKALAYGMGAHYIEQDVVMTRDNQLIILHDLSLERTTNVAEVFPGRARQEGEHAGHYLAIDFTLAEIRRLQVFEGSRNKNGTREVIYPGRFPLGHSRFRVHTLAEEIEMIQGLNQSTGREVGIYPEIKAPAFHHAEGKDLSTALVAMLKHYGYASKNDKVFVQTFDHAELQRLHDEVLPQAGIQLKLVQLISADSDGNVDAEYAEMLSPTGLQDLSRYADGIGPDKSLIMQTSPNGEAQVTGLVNMAQVAGLQVHPYTYRMDAGQVPDYADSFTQLLELHLFTAEVDGVFTDFPDRAIKVLIP